MKKLTKALTPVIAFAALAVSLAACTPMNTPVAGNPEPSSTEPAPAPTYTHIPVGQAVPPPPGSSQEGEGNFYWVRLVTRVYDETGTEATGFDSPQVHFVMNADTASGNPAVVYDQKNMKFNQVPVEWDNYPPIKDEQHLQELTEYADGTWHGILGASWTLTVTLNPGWRISCILVDVGSGLTVSRRSFLNSGATTTRGTVSCFWPYDPSPVNVPIQP